MKDKKRKVLLIEDNPMFIKLIGEYFKDGFNTIFDLHSEELLRDGIESLSNNEFDAILLDLNLPDSDGIDTLLKLEPEKRNIAIIVLTGMDDEELASEALRYGAQDYLVKGNFSPELLIKSIYYAIERNESKIALQESEENYRILVDNQSDLIVKVDLEGKFLFVSKSYCKMFGKTEEELIGKNFLPLVHHDDREKTETAMKNLFYPPYTAYMEQRAYTKEGWKWLAWVDTAILDKNNNIKSIIGVGRDIDERKKAEIELIRVQDLLLNIINSMSSILICIDRKYEIIRWNSVAEDFFDIKFQDALSKNIYELLPFTNEYREIILEVICNKDQKHIHKVNLGNKKKYYNIYFSPLFTENEIQGVVIRIDDITEFELKEEQLRQSHKLETVGMLSGGIAHDFNNILSAIIGSVCLMQFKIENNTNIKELLNDDIQIIDKSLARAKKLVSNLLMLSRKKDILINQFNLIDAVKNVLEICFNTFDKSVEVKSNFLIDESPIIGDQGQIEQVILNLCINSLHSMTIMRDSSEKQGGILSVSVESFFPDNEFLLLHQEAIDTKYCVVKISDTGIGMDSETISKIFYPFFTTKHKEKGTGLGLLMVQNIVKEHRGFVTVYSELGKGSVFTVYLPNSTGINKINFFDNNNKTDLIIKGSGTILVIDDEEIVRITTKKMLEKCGYSVLLAEDGTEGLKTFIDNKDKIDLVLLDMSMPKNSGKEVFEKLKEIDSNLKVVITSGLEIDERIEQILNSGALAFINKPYSLNDLSLVLKNHLNQ